MKIINNTKNTTVADSCVVADSFFTRFLGLMGKSTLPNGFCLMITPCNSIHMFFMKIPLDVIFIDSNNIVLHTIENIKPWKISKIVKNARSAIELPIGTILQSKTTVGDQLKIK